MRASANRRSDGVGVPVDLDVVPALDDLAVRVNQVGRADDAHVFAPVARLLLPYAVFFCHGVISGYSDGTFRPNNEVTRGQLAKIIVRAEEI